MSLNRVCVCLPACLPVPVYVWECVCVCFAIIAAVLVVVVVGATDHAQHSLWSQPVGNGLSSVTSSEWAQCGSVRCGSVRFSTGPGLCPGGWDCPCTTSVAATPQLPQPYEHTHTAVHPCACVYVRENTSHGRSQAGIEWVAWGGAGEDGYVLLYLHYTWLWLFTFCVT